MARLVWLGMLVLAAAAPGARAQQTAAVVPGQMWLFLAPEEHTCAGPVSSWRDASDPVAFATGPTARLDAQELWAATGLPPMVAARYGSGVLRMVILGVASQTRIELNRSTVRSRWPFC